MTGSMITALVWFMAVGCGLIAGVYFAFSAFIMTALSRSGQANGIAAMIAINIVILQSPFMPLFFGTSLGALAVATIGGLRWDKPGSLLLLAGGLIFAVGMTGVTIAFNVPLNNALVAVTPESAQGATLWSRYLADWTMWNHVRTLASTIACICFIAALASR